MEIRVFERIRFFIEFCDQDLDIHLCSVRYAELRAEMCERYRKIEHY